MASERINSKVIKDGTQERSLLLTKSERYCELILEAQADQKQESIVYDKLFVAEEYFKQINSVKEFREQAEIVQQRYEDMMRHDFPNDFMDFEDDMPNFQSEKSFIPLKDVWAVGEKYGAVSFTGDNGNFYVPADDVVLVNETGYSGTYAYAISESALARSDFFQGQTASTGAAPRSQIVEQIGASPKYTHKQYSEPVSGPVIGAIYYPATNLNVEELVTYTDGARLEREYTANLDSGELCEKLTAEEAAALQKPVENLIRAQISQGKDLLVTYDEEKQSFQKALQEIRNTKKTAPAEAQATSPALEKLEPQWKSITLPDGCMVNRYETGTMFRMPETSGAPGYVFFHPNKLIQESSRSEASSIIGPDGETYTSEESVRAHKLTYNDSFIFKLRKGKEEIVLSSGEFEKALEGAIPDAIAKPHKIMEYSQALTPEGFLVYHKGLNGKELSHLIKADEKLKTFLEESEENRQKYAQNWIEGYNLSEKGNPDYARYYADTLKRLEDAGETDTESYILDEKNYTDLIAEQNGAPKAKAYVNDRLYEKNCPLPLRSRKQFICWKREWDEKKDGGKGGWTKPPYSALTGYQADPTRSSSWSDFETACKAVDKFGLDGVGIALGRGLIGIDIDNCINDKGEISKEATDIITKVNSYTELSPSGKGIHILTFGEMPAGPNRKGNFEMYGQGRYFTLTGNLYQGKFIKVAKSDDAAAGIKEVHSTYFNKPKREAGTTQSALPATALRVNVKFEDSKIIDKLSKSKNGADFKRLYNGDFSQYKSQSDGDIALCGQIAYYTDDKAQVDRIFRSSALMRDKWDEFHGEDTYGNNTINLAYKNRTRVYDPEFAKRQAIDAKRNQSSGLKPNIMD